MKTLLLSLLLCVQSFAGTWYVDSAATGANDGTSWADAFESFADTDWSAIAKTEHQPIYISGGSTSKTYAETFAVAWKDTSGFTLTIRPGQDASHNGIVYLEGSPTGCGLKFGTDSEYASPYSFDQADYVTLDGSYNGAAHIIIRDTYDKGIYFRYGPGTNNTVRYVNVTDCGLGVAQGHGIRMDTGDAVNTLIEYCVISGNEQDGINWNDETAAFDSLTIRFCTIYGNQDDSIQCGGGVTVHNCTMDGTGYDEEGGTNHPDAIQGTAGYWKIYNNKMGDHTQELFIQSEPADGGVLNDIKIYNNVFYRTDEGEDVSILLSMNTGSADPTWDNIEIIGNTFDGGYTTLRLLSKTVGSDITLTDCEFSNNLITAGGIITMNGASEGTQTWTAGEFLARNNLFFDSTTSIKWKTNSYTTVSSWQTANGTDCSGNIVGTATFSNAAALDYTLLSGDALNNGVTLSAPYTTDAIGTLRPQGAAFDIGAYELFVPANQPTGRYFGTPRRRF